MNEIFSSLVFDVKFDRSKKLSVDIGKEEKNECDGRVAGVGLLLAWRDMRDDKRAEKEFVRSIISYLSEALPCRSLSRLSIPGIGFPALSRKPPRLSCVLKGVFPLRCTAYITHPREYISDAVTSCSSRAYSGAVLW